MTDEFRYQDPMTDAERAEAEALAASLDDRTSDSLPSRGLLSFYDRLRHRIDSVVGQRGGRLAQGTTGALMLVPDTFMLLLRLSLDRDVPRSTRALIGGALAYFVLPVDLLPEALVGPVGYVDDLVLALSVLAHAFGRDLEPWARKYWSGPEDLRRVIGDVLGAARGLLSDDLYHRLESLLHKRGIDLDQTTADAREAARHAASDEPDVPSPS